MPFVRIDALRADSATLDALGRAVQEAIVESLGVPATDRFQVLVSHDGITSKLTYDNYLGIERDDGIVFVAIMMREGRTTAQKQALYRRIADLAKEYAGMDPRNVFISVTENQSVDWSMGNGIAQYVVDTGMAASAIST